MSRPALLLVLLAGLAAAPAAQTWVAAPSMATPRAGAAGAVLGGRLYVVGGRDAAGGVLASAEVFDPATGWAALPPLPAGVAEASAVALGGRLYIVGGREADGPSDDVWIYDPAARTWRRDDRSLEEERAGVAAGAVGGVLYALGGGDEHGLWASAETRTATDWTLYAPWTLAPARALPGVAAWRDALVLAGGFSTFGPLATVERFAPGAAPVRLPSLGVARGGLALVATDSALVAVGGRNAADQPSAVVERWTADTAAWTRGPSLPEPREGTVAAVLDGDLYVVGGASSFGSVLRSVVRLAGAVGTDAPPVASPLALAVEGAQPARGPLRLALTLAAPADVTVAVIDALGRTVAVLADGPHAAGRYALAWTPGASGVYVVTATSGRARAAVRVSGIR